MTSLGSRRKDNSEARHPPEEQGETGEHWSDSDHRDPNLDQLHLKTEPFNT